MFTSLSYCEITTHSLEIIFLQLKCHFTWNVCGEESSLDDLEDRGYNQVEFLNTEFKAITYNLFAYIKHCRGQYQVALEYLEQAEDFIMHRQDHQGKMGHLVTWGNYAWVCYHLGRLLEVHTSVHACMVSHFSLVWLFVTLWTVAHQAALSKGFSRQEYWRHIRRVGNLCKKYTNSYRIEYPEIESEEGEALLKCGEKYYEQAMQCFERLWKRNSPTQNSPWDCSSHCIVCKTKHQQRTPFTFWGRPPSWSQITDTLTFSWLWLFNWSRKKQKETT